MLVEHAPEGRIAVYQLDVEIGVKLAKRGRDVFHHVEVKRLHAGKIGFGGKAQCFGGAHVAGAGGNTEEQDLLLLHGDWGSLGFRGDPGDSGMLGILGEIQGGAHFMTKDLTSVSSPGLRIGTRNTCWRSLGVFSSVISATCATVMASGPAPLP